MKSASREQIKYLPVPSTDSNFSSGSLFRTQRVTKSRGKYVHYFVSQFGNDLEANTETAEIQLPATNCGYRINWETNRKTHIRFYTLVSGTLQYLVDTSDKFTRYIGKRGTFTCSAKIVAVATSDPVKAIIYTEPTEYRPLSTSPYLELSRRSKGHQTYLLKEDYLELSQQIREYSLRHSLPRSLTRYSNPPPAVEFAEGLIYYLHLDSIVTISTHIDTEDRCEPFSIRLKSGSNICALVDYEIELCPCAGEDAEITITAIETISADTYVNIRDSAGRPLIHSHVGKIVKGQFSLPVGLTDVGLHIYTPYGYGDDTRKDKYTDLAVFRSYRVTYLISS